MMARALEVETDYAHQVETWRVGRRWTDADWARLRDAATVFHRSRRVADDEPGLSLVSTASLNELCLALDRESPATEHQRRGNRKPLASLEERS